MNTSMTGYRGPTGSNIGPTSTGARVGGYKVGQLQNFTPEQMQLFRSLFSNVSPDSFLSKLAQGDQSGFAQSELPALRQFNEQQGNIASRFSGMGTGGRKSSGFKNTLNQASQEFSQNLQSRRMDMQRQALQDLLGFSNQLLGQRPYEQFLYQKPQKSSFLQQLLGGASQGLGSLGSMYGLGKLGLF